MRTCVLSGFLRGRRLLFVSGLAGALTLGLQARAAAEPHRIVSLNMCSDELVLRLADRADVASVTWLSRNAEASNVAALADTVPINHGSVEEVLASHPDLIVAGRHTTRVTVATLRGAGLPVLELDVPHDLADIRKEITAVAAAVGRPDRGGQLVDSIDEALAHLPPPDPAKRPRALVFNPNGFTVGHGTLLDEILTRAGLDNVAGELGVASYGRVPLEAVVAGHVDILVLGVDDGRSPALATEILHHPVLSDLRHHLRTVTLPSRLWTCGGPRVVEAIERLIAARRGDEAEAR